MCAYRTLAQLLTAQTSSRKVQTGSHDFSKTKKITSKAQRKHILMPKQEWKTAKSQKCTRTLALSKYKLCKGQCRFPQGIIRSNRIVSKFIFTKKYFSLYLWIFDEFVFFFFNLIWQHKLYSVLFLCIFFFCFLCFLKKISRTLALVKMYVVCLFTQFVVEILIYMLTLFLFVLMHNN